MFTVTILDGLTVLNSWNHNRLSVAGKIYANPGVLVPFNVYQQATTVILTSTAMVGRWRRTVRDPVWLIGIEGTNYPEIRDLTKVHWDTELIETAHKQLCGWYPKLDPWLALTIANRIRNAMQMKLSIWVALDEIEVYPNQVEIRKLTEQQKRDDNETE